MRWGALVQDIRLIAAADGGAASTPRQARLAVLRAELAGVPGLGEPAGAEAGGPPASGLGAIDEAFAAGGLPRAAVHELYGAGPACCPAAAGFALALAAHLQRAARGGRAGGDQVWVYPRGQAQDCGLPYGPGLMALGHDPGRFLLVEAASTLEALWVAEEVLRASAPAGVVALLDASYLRHAFTASRRLELAARAGLASAILIHPGRQAPTSAASLRWRVEPLASSPGTGGMGGARGLPFPARPRWRVVLERNRHGECGAFSVEWNHERARLETLAPDAGAVAAALGGGAGARQIGRVAGA